MILLTDYENIDQDNIIVDLMTTISPYYTCPHCFKLIIENAIKCNKCGELLHSHCVDGHVYEMHFPEKGTEYTYYAGRWMPVDEYCAIRQNMTEKQMIEAYVATFFSNADDWKRPVPFIDKKKLKKPLKYRIALFLWRITHPFNKWRY